MRISDWSSDVCSSDLEITLQLNGLYSYNSDISPFSSQSLNGNTVGRRAPNPTGIPTDIAFPTKPRQTATQFVPFSSARTKLIDGHVEVDLGFATLSGQIGRAHV